MFFILFSYDNLRLNGRMASAGAAAAASSVLRNEYDIKELRVAAAQLQQQGRRGRPEQSELSGEVTLSRRLRGG